MKATLKSCSLDEYVHRPERKRLEIRSEVTTPSSSSQAVPLAVLSVAFEGRVLANLDFGRRFVSPESFAPPLARPLEARSVIELMRDAAYVQRAPSVIRARFRCDETRNCKYVERCR